MALTNIRLNKKGTVIADREVHGKTSQKAIAKPGYKGAYKWCTTNASARQLARSFAATKGLDFSQIDS